MRRLLIRVTFASLAIFLLAAVLRAEDGEGLMEAFQAVKHSRLDQETTKAIDGFMIEHQDIRIVLDSGRIALFKPVLIDEKPHIYAAWFEGRGQFYFSPSEKDARDRVLYYEDRDSVSLQFKKILLVFSRDIAGRLTGAVKPCERSFGKGSGKSAEASWERLIRDDNNYHIFEMLRNLTELSARPYLLANPQTEDWSNSFYYVYDPLAAEEIRLLKSTVRGPNFAQFLKTLCSYTCLAIDSGKYHGELAEPQIMAQHYKIDAFMDDLGDFKCAVSIRYRVLKGPGQLLRMFIHQDAEIDSISSPEHAQVYDIRYEKDKNKSARMYLILDRPMSAGDVFSLNFYYRAPLIRFSGRDLTGNLGSSWYPMYINPDQATYEITYDIPHFDDLELVSTGVPVSTERVGNRTIENWEVTDPVYQVTFEFDEIEK